MSHQGNHYGFRKRKEIDANIILQTYKTSQRFPENSFHRADSQIIFQIRTALETRKYYLVMFLDYIIPGIT